MDLLDRMRKIQVREDEVMSLVAKCQENGWLRYGGYAWQDDPWLEEYPYAFVRTDSMDDLREFFAHGNWAIRQGALFHDLAFIQQDDGGDEWWTLRRLDDGEWLAFESWSFGEVAKDAADFSSAIVSMEMASPYECEHLIHTLPDNGLVWTSRVSEEPIADGGPELVRTFEGKGEDGTLTISKTPGEPGYACSFTTPEGEIRELGVFANALDAAKLGLEQVAAKSRFADSARQEALSERAIRVRDAAISENEHASMRNQRIESPSRQTGRS
ncbi:MAG: hypothetical protein IJF97_08220 [Eggerthellaceae bacterium]|nr:hypothetical protein [Eggerthellaceae bacterium]